MYANAVSASHRTMRPATRLRVIMADQASESTRTLCECTVRCKGVALSLCVLHAKEFRRACPVKRPPPLGTSSSGSQATSSTGPEMTEWIVLVGSQGPNHGGRINAFTLREGDINPKSAPTLTPVINLPLDAPPTAFAPYQVTMA